MYERSFFTKLALFVVMSFNLVESIFRGVIFFVHPVQLEGVDADDLFFM